MAHDLTITVIFYMSDKEEKDTQNAAEEEQKEEESEDESYSDSDKSNLDKDGILISISKVYQNANIELGKPWYSVESFLPVIQSPSGYKIKKKVGRGKFSTVYLAYARHHKKVALKVLVPVDIRKYMKEIKILMNLDGQHNVVKFYGLIQDPLTKIYTMVFEWVETQPWKQLYQKLGLDDIRHYMRLLMEGLEYSHSHGIVHRDLKPDNIGIDIKNKTLKILDWGLAEFYFPGKRMNPQSGTRSYQSPEQQIKYPYYDYSTDIWSAGLIFGMMLFKTHVIPASKEPGKQILELAKVIGGQTVVNLVGFLEMRMLRSLIKELLTIKAQGYEALIKNAPPELCDPDALDLLKKMLTPDFRYRITAHDALQHPFFHPKPKAESTDNPNSTS